MYLFSLVFETLNFFSSRLHISVFVGFFLSLFFRSFLHLQNFLCFPCFFFFVFTIHY